MNDLSETIRAMMLTNVSEGPSRFRGEQYCYIRPSSEDSPSQSWWDTCFQVMVLCRLGEYPLATRILSSLFAVQEDSGFCGHRVHWKKTLPRWNELLQARPRWDALRPRMSALIQPPMAAVALERIYQGTHDMAYLKCMLAKLIRYFNWLDRERAYDGSGLLSTVSPLESGVPYKPSYDRLLGFTHGKADAGLRRRTLAVDAGNFLRGHAQPARRPSGRFLAKDVLVNTLYARDLRALSRLCSIAGFIQATELFERRAEKVTRAILDLMYDPERGAFFDLDAGQQRIPVLTFSTFLPLMLPELPGDVADMLVKRHLRNRREFDLPQGLPTVSAGEPAFAPDGEGRFLWRGSVWPAANWCIWQGLMQQGFHEEGQQIAYATEVLLARNGLRECYHPFTGAGGGAHHCALSGLILDMQGTRAIDARASYTAPQREFRPGTSLGGLPAASL